MTKHQIAAAIYSAVVNDPNFSFLMFSTDKVTISFDDSNNAEDPNISIWIFDEEDPVLIKHNGYTKGGAVHIRDVRAANYELVGERVILSVFDF